MDDLPEFFEQEKLTAFLSARSLSDVLMVANRAALRVVPSWIEFVFLADAVGLPFSVLPVLRANLVCAVTLSGTTAGLRINRSMVQIAGELTLLQSESSDKKLLRSQLNGKSSTIVVNHARPALMASIYTLRNLMEFKDGDAIRVNAAVATITGLSGEAGAYSHGLHDDLGQLTSGRGIANLPLWPSANPRADSWETAKGQLSSIPGGSFWIDWYQRALDGRPQNWPLLRDVALIDDALWEQGGEALDREIERLRLLDEVRRLKAELAEAGSVTVVAAVPHRGHNRPPELLPNYASEISGVARIIADQLNEAEEELQRQRPSPSRLKQIGQAIRKAAMSVLTYCAGLGDEVLKGAAKEIGASGAKWLGRGVAGYIVAHNQTFRELADALIRLADKF